MRPIFFAPWWWFVWSTGKRFSLRRALSLALGVLLASEVVVAGARFAFHGQAPDFAIARTTAAWAIVASFSYSLVEPAFYVLGDCVRAGTWAPGRLREVSYGLQFAYAVGSACGIFALAPRVAVLAGVLTRARAQNGLAGGDARFVIGATIVMFPIVIIARLLALRARPVSPAATAPRQSPPRRAIPFRDDRRITSGYVPPPIVPVAPRPARIINVEIGPSEPPDQP